MESQLYAKSKKLSSYYMVYKMQKYCVFYKNHMQNISLLLYFSGDFFQIFLVTKQHKTDTFGII